jgi:predicted aspartyl protease
VRPVLVVLCPFLLAGADFAQLRQLEEAKRYFELRRALQQTTSDDAEIRYYRAVIAARFGQEEAAVGPLRAFLETSPDGPAQKRRAHNELADALMRLGRYREAAAELALTADEAAKQTEAETAPSLWDALRDVAPQSVEFGADTPVQAKLNNVASWTVPVELNGKKAAWILDTGASMSVLTESEAKKLGLEVRDTSNHASSGHTGKQTPLRVAVAPELRLGRARLRNVVFGVVPDGAMHVGPLGLVRLPGVLGFPVIRALGSMSISATGVVRIQPQSPRMEGEPNIFFHGSGVVVEVRHAGRAVPMGLDTGGNVSYLYPAFREILTPEEREKLTKQRIRSGGLGGTISLETEMVPVLQLEAPGRTVELHKIALRSQGAQAGGGESDGLLGMDALKGGFTVDFRTMRMKLD